MKFTEELKNKFRSYMYVGDKVHVLDMIGEYPSTKWTYKIRGIESIKKFGKDIQCVNMDMENQDIIIIFKMEHGISLHYKFVSSPFDDTQYRHWIKPIGWEDD